MDEYQKLGYADRQHYLKTLAREYGVTQKEVFLMADLMGENEDFDGLVSMLEDSMDYL